MDYEVVIGLEVHAQLSTATKLFCGCSTPFGDPPNTHGCPVCLGLPGALPVINREAVDRAVRVGIAVGSSISPKSIFARKNYFYPDLPKGYQISQYDLPLCSGGALPISVDGKEKRIGITRIHLEEDAGKLVHDRDVESLFDVNRCGTPLIEIVSEPDLRSPAEAYQYLMGLKRILEYLDVCDCTMEEGSLRCDANVSIRPRGETRLGVKVEIKNMNSFRGLEKALDYEARRQEEVIRSGGTVQQQTFLWDPDTGRSVLMRSKEDAHDYRYFPDPDLVPLLVDTARVETLKKTLPELPAARSARFETTLGLTPYMADVLTANKEIADYFEETLHYFTDATVTAHWVMSEILRIANERKCGVSALRITPKRLAGILGQISCGAISAQAAKKAIALVHEEDREPETIIAEKGLAQVSDTALLETAVQQTLDTYPAEAERYKAGETKLMGFFVGQAIKLTSGKGNPKEISSLVRKMLG